MADTFAVLGDLGEGKYIVRMFVGDNAFDEEFTITVPDYSPEEVKVSDLREQIEKRMNKVSTKEAGKLNDDTLQRPLGDDHAVDMKLGLEA